MLEINRYELAKNLAELRNANGFSCKHIAKVMHVTPAAVTLWEKNGEIKTEKLYALAKFYDQKIEDIISGNLTKKSEFEITPNLSVFDKHDFSDLQNANKHELFVYLYEMNEVKKFLFKKMDDYVENKLEKKEVDIFSMCNRLLNLDYTFSNVKLDDATLYSAFQYLASNFKGKEREYEFSKVLQFRFQFNVMDLFDLNKYNLSRMLIKILSPMDRNKILTVRLKKLRQENIDIKDDFTTKELLKAGAQVIYESTDFLDNQDELVLDYIEGDIIENEKLTKAARILCNDYPNNEDYDEWFYRHSWKSLNLNEADVLVNDYETSRVKAIVNDNFGLNEKTL